MAVASVMPATWPAVPPARPVPNCPLALLPQQDTVPFTSRAQV